ncbi:MAG: PPC domain-containing protein [Fimbriimonadales bacterium]|nr:PPC domain-containing protein [Fimbriimonadales bacterium]
MRRYERRRVVLWGLLLVWSWLGYEPCPAAHPTRFALNENSCFWMVAIEPGQTVSFSRRLEGGTRYRLFVMSDSHTTELDVAVADPLGAVIAQSSDAPRETLLRFTPPATGTYTLRLTVKKAQGATRCAVLLLPEQGDWKGAHFHWNDALKQIQRLLTMLEEQGQRVAFVAEGVCMVGGFVSAGRAVEFGHWQVGSGTFIWAAVGDSRVRSLQLTLRRDERDAVKGGGRGKPLALCAATTDGLYTPRVSLQDADGEAFVIVAILKVSENEANRPAPQCAARNP